MKRAAIAGLLVLLCGPVILAQDYSVNTARGFNVNGVYQMNGIDSINTYNGNLTLSIPVGQAYPIGGGLSYQLRLHYNGSIWESEERDHCVPDDPNPPVCHPDGPFNYAYPHRGANAGIGWVLSLGRMYAPDQAPNDSAQWAYESPDGSIHRFFTRLHADGTETGFVNENAGGYTRDGTYLRMRDLGNGTRVVEFPRGEVHTFAAAPDGSHWRPISISNQYPANNLSITYPSASQWVLSDGFREHTVNLLSRPWSEDVGGARMLVDTIVLKTFGTTTATYKLQYTQATLRRPFPPEHTYPPELASLWATVQVLSKIVLPDDTPASDTDNRAYTFTAPDGRPAEMRLPTGGAVQWTWAGEYKYPQGPNSGRTVVGVISRRTYDICGSTCSTLIGETTYDPDLDIPTSLELSKEMKNTVTDPLGNKTEYYFSVSPFDSGNWKANEYGLPLTKFTGDGSGTRWLSQRFISGTQTLRSTYLAYEHDTPPFEHSPLDNLNRRIRSTRVVHDDDVVSGEARYVQTDYSSFDGLGHYRTVTTSTNIAETPTRTATTEFNPAAGTYPGSFTMTGIAPDWLTETYASTTVEEGDRAIRAEFCFDEDGFLTRSRALRNVQRFSNGAPLGIAAARSSSDIISVSAPDERGNPASGELYGGDKGNVATGSLCATSFALGTRIERIDYVHPSPSSPEATSQYPGFDYFHTDTTIDLGTGLPASSRDPAGVETTYQYDSLGRMTLVSPSGRATTKYVYNSTNPAEVSVTQYPAGTQSGTVLTKTRYVFDGQGRVVKEFVTMPDGTESRRETNYTKLGQTESVSELGTATTLPKTVMTYDALGRTKTITPPAGSGSLTEFDYIGERSKTRKARIWTGAATVVSTVETYDGHGRLASVEEPSGPTSSLVRSGSNVLTAYRYDPAGRLLSVTMKKSSSSDAVQQRLFDHDGRGFLRWESHPESGVTSYVYDARGLLLEKNQGAAGTLFDLKYQYDAAGRLTEVRGRNPFFDPADASQPEFRIIKSFTFAGDNDDSVTDPPHDETPRSSLSRGKLLTATRFNYPDDPELGPIYKIEHIYHYLDAAGRPGRRITKIFSIDDEEGSEWDDETLLQSVTLQTTFDDLDRQKTVRYPICLDCGLPLETPDRTITTTRAKGRVVSLSDFVPSVTYSPNGLRNVLTHANSIADTQTSSIMTRPDSIGFATYKNCARPVITVQPSGGSQSGGAITLTVTATGSAGPAGLVYQWYNDEGAIPDATDATYLVPTLTAATGFWVEIIGACGYVKSHVAVVTPSGCADPETGLIAVHNQPDGSKKLVPDPTYRSSPGFPLFEWRRTSDNSLMGTSETLTIASLTTTTTYSLKVRDACGDSSVTTVTLQVAPAMPATLSATKSGSTQITVTWPSVPGQSTLTLERRSGIYWDFVAEVSGTSYVDSGLAPGRTYAYRLRASGAYSNSDVASTLTFTPVVPRQSVDAAAFDAALLAVNNVREAAGWPAVTWENVLSSTDPLPEPGAEVSLRHIAACRARVNEALQALGALVAAYTDPDLTVVPIKTVHINDIYARAQ